jgi:3',5'-cyclic-AMP phosphodiesterase
MSHDQLNGASSESARVNALPRRSFLGVLGAGLAGAVGAPALAQSGDGAGRKPIVPPGGSAPKSAAAARTRVLRFAHLTDTHVQPERGGSDGFAACLKHVMDQPDRPQMVLTGGDLIMDAFAQEQPRAQMLFDLFIRVLRDGCGVPVRHTLGNHDIWGWDQRRSKTTSAEARWGKAWAVEALGLTAPNYAFEQSGWKFVVLDSVQPFRGNAYTSFIDEAQWSWLEGELKAACAAGTPVVVSSHIPIFSVGALDHDGKTTPEAWRLDGGVMHTDASKLMALFRANPCVKLCVSGHIHKVDRLDYEGVSFLGGGAVSGAWWKGRETRCDEGYNLIDLYSDGTFDHAYQTYGWTVRPE